MPYPKVFIFIIYLFCLLIPLSTFGQERVIKPGDAIEIIVYGHEELSQTVIVSVDGTMDFPSLQGLPIDGITLQRFQKILVTQLSRYMERSPLVTVRFAERYPIKVTILGQVANPGMYVIFNTSTIQGAISAAGGFIPGAQLSQIKLIRTNGNEMSNQVVNMENFYLTGDPTYLPKPKDGDTIVVPGNPLVTTVKVLGCVERPGSYEVSFRTGLLDVIYLAGGPTDEANLNTTRIISLTNQNIREVQINIKRLLKAKNFQSIPIVVPGDIVYIPPQKVTWKKFLSIIRDITTFAMLYYLIRISN
ncbi:MAG: SLBB domain-containing protein [Candidatus Hodarchaeota archaeon]